MMPERWWEETLLGMQMLGLNFLLQLMLENPAAAVAALAQVLHRRLPLLVAVNTLWTLRMTNPAVSDKFCSTLLHYVTAACLASVASTVMHQQLLGHIFLYLHFREEALSTTGWLNHCLHIVWLPAE